MARFSTVEEFLDAQTDPEQRAKLEGLLGRVGRTWPELECAVKWNQPMFLHHGTYIIGFSVFPKNIAVGPEVELMERMRADIEAAGYTTTQRLFRKGRRHRPLAPLIRSPAAGPDFGEAHLSVTRGGHPCDR